MPKISVIIPVYNSEKTVAETLESVLAQTYGNLEIIIVDDGATDKSIEICRQFKDKRIKIIHQQNRGLAGARNTGIRHAKGEFLAFVDSDDLWLPEKLEKHLQHLQRSPQVGVSFSRSLFIDDQSKPLGIYQMPKLKNITPEYLFCRNPISNGSSVVIRRDVLTAIKFEANVHGEVEDFYFDDRFRQSEDIECWLRIALQTTWKIEGIPEALTLYRLNSGGLSANLFKQYESWEQILIKTQVYNPEFIEQWGDKARAYQLRYLARRATRQRSSRMAVTLINQALGTYWQIILEEPRRTFISFIAAYLLWLLPKSIYQWLEKLIMQITGANQQKRIQKEQMS
ncbi:glycosyltransferase family 2 protein [Anabaena cylindrica FACHB-243]|uniref:Glycosyl transferase family 2 n=1 Tax=Anabaena cylindrica (strain ATCC 27899 / PCC 7122) TaxID=272123 RepID=K9ZJY4_ANACC|nr:MULTISPECIES: glycosyltransferase family 2 protein [Anabaena]AFZ58640.1 glycosyl transferase family 2 [Anabaena cylindrica PCC 7122]MBD2419985.1 glycosyltransferase family 2 protein [Anabaena cylindrica FACHB-243]MBY5282893.1 glycosyltransferase family 2 protein [Anabaena sp. CCAP 1446/1C]MBY5310397.1 glycosyltransferase family 2 protein [Anabaena sp. CCAP 1446/1C]MCM2407121.1 glycosyltransferase [Anabaena sp. CCAP 1446/1C]